MSQRWRALLLCLLSVSAAAQGRFPTPPNNATTNSGPIDAVQAGMENLKVFTMVSPGNNLLKVYARKGYYAAAPHTSSSER